MTNKKDHICKSGHLVEPYRYCTKCKGEDGHWQHFRKATEKELEKLEE